MSAQESRIAEVAWAAGLWEGEGCFSSTYSNQRAKRKRFIAALKMTDEDIVRRFHGIVGFGAVRTYDGKPPRKRVWIWQTNRENEFRALVEMFEPYMGARRRACAYELLNELGTINLEQLRVVG